MLNKAKWEIIEKRWHIVGAFLNNSASTDIDCEYVLRVVSANNRHHRVNHLFRRIDYHGQSEPLCISWKTKRRELATNNIQESILFIRYILRSHCHPHFTVLNQRAPCEAVHKHMT